MIASPLVLCALCCVMTASLLVLCALCCVMTASPLVLCALFCVMTASPVVLCAFAGWSVFFNSVHVCHLLLNRASRIDSDLNMLACQSRVCLR